MARRLPVPLGSVLAIEVAAQWRWFLILPLAGLLVGHALLPRWYPAWDSPTIWLVSTALVLVGEAVLLMHELGHALGARLAGHTVRRIVLHGLCAETEIDLESGWTLSPVHAMRVALLGPCATLPFVGVLALISALLPAGHSLAPLVAWLAWGTLAAAALSLVPVGGSDGARFLQAVRALRASRDQSH